MLMSRKQIRAVVEMQPTKKYRDATEKYLNKTLGCLVGTFDSVSEMTDHERSILRTIIDVVEKEKQEKES